TPTPQRTPTPTPLHITPTPSPSPTATSSFTPTPTPTVVVIRPADSMPAILIPATTFLMGAVEDDEEAGDDERPAHQVTLDAFYIDQYEVSVAQYAAFLNDNGGYVNACGGFTCLSTRFETLDSYLVENTNGFAALSGFEGYPINNVSWFGARTYCEWAGARLPAEAEWELAARGVDGRRYPWGDALLDASLAIFGGDSIAALRPVDALEDGVSPFNIYGLAGSVWEWVADGYQADYYEESPSQNPTGPAAGTFSRRALRGGGYSSAAAELRATNRHSGPPAEFRNIPDVGFRCAQGF
ncbi:MAG: formylglycine-generating enzyme family protein, partial [Chloroflexi bacterium]|nr:formylglycine-generating enzyme family protein [Chloroflexota bacterium]